MGGTGNLPVLPGDPPGGMEVGDWMDRVHLLNASAIPSGESPDGTGGSPVLPNRNRTLPTFPLLPFQAFRNCSTSGKVFGRVRNVWSSDHTEVAARHPRKPAIRNGFIRAIQNSKIQRPGTRECLYAIHQTVTSQAVGLELDCAGSETGAPVPGGQQSRNLELHCAGSETGAPVPGGQRSRSLELHCAGSGTGAPAPNTCAALCRIMSLRWKSPAVRSRLIRGKVKAWSSHPKMKQAIQHQSLTAIYPDLESRLVKPLFVRGQAFRFRHYVVTQHSNDPTPILHGSLQYSVLSPRHSGLAVWRGLPQYPRLAASQRRSGL
jgi:hypothetical protein